MRFSGRISKNTFEKSDVKNKKINRRNKDVKATTKA
jgi:hypothetical protein